METQGGFLISRIKHLSDRVFERLLKECGIDVFNGPQGRILYVLWQHEELPISRIGQLTSLAKTTMTGMLDRMEEAGLIRRVPDQKNRRQILVSITPTMKEYRDQYDRVSERMNQLFYKGFSEEEIARFEIGLKAIIRNLEFEGENSTNG